MAEYWNKMSGVYNFLFVSIGSSVELSKTG